MKFSERYEVREAGKKGRGLFAVTSFKSSEFVLKFSGQIVPDLLVDQEPFDSVNQFCFKLNAENYLCPLNLDKIDDIFFVNHSCDPNVGFKDQITLVAIREILPNQELTFDYVMTDGDRPGMLGLPTPDFRCLCGSPQCREIITGQDWRRTDLQQKYRGYFSPYVQGLINSLDSFSGDYQSH